MNAQGGALLAALAVLAVSWAAAPLAAQSEKNTSDDGEAPLTAEEILANPLQDSDYAQTTRCLSTARYRRVEIVNSQALAFHGRGDDVWLNMLHRRCIGLRKDMILSIEQTSLRVCARDRVKGMSRNSYEAAAVCSLGRFQRLSKPGFDAMRDALLAGERNLTVARTLRSAGQAAGAEAKQDDGKPRE